VISSFEGTKKTGSNLISDWRLLYGILIMWSFVSISLHKCRVSLVTSLFGLVCFLSVTSTHWT
jgi:hypothetical protein